MACRNSWTLVVGSCLVLGACGADEPVGPGVSALKAELAAANTWQGRRGMPAPARAEMHAATVNGVIYVIGGNVADESTVPGVNVDAYQVASNTWSPRQPLPSARSAINGASVIGGKIYVTGGWRQIPGGIKETKTLLVYTPATNLWAQKADVPDVGREGSQGVINGLLYVYTTGFATTGSHGFFRYNPATNRWTTLPKPPIEHFAGVAGVIGGKFYLVGGYDVDCCSLRTLHVYDPATNKWTTKAPMRVARNGVAGGVIGGKLYVAGGYTGPWRNTLEVYDPVTNTWSTKAPMPIARSHAAGAVAGGKLYVFGGYFSSGQTTSVLAYTP